MGLQYPAEWKFEGIGIETPADAVREFFAVVKKIASGDSEPQEVFEAFKSAFGVQSYSSDAGWAETDLFQAMLRARDNAASFVAAFWDGVEAARRRGTQVPSAGVMNKILDTWEVPLVIDPPQLKLKQGDIAIVSDEDSEAGSTSPVYQRIEQIGQGGFGTVYRVKRSTVIGEFEFAMKVLDPSAFVKNKERALERFKREIRILSKIQHRGIVPHIEAGLDADQRPYILMPYIEGKDLREALSGAAPRDVLHAFDEVLAALEYAHSSDIIHRDLKPSNVLVRASDHQPVLLDFGCAYCWEDADENSLTTTLIGSRPYIPIEVVRNPKHRTPKQDVYACGIMLYEVLANCHPVPEDYEAIEGLLDGYPGIDRVVQDGIAPERKRIESATVFRQRLHEIAAEASKAAAHRKR